jgi:putative endonuclease
MRQACVYILASRMSGTLYIGATSDLVRRVWQHKTGEYGGFTAEYGVKDLVYFEMHDTMPEAILREKRMKKWRRAWKIALIERGNPLWRDLYEDLVGMNDGSPLSRG